MEQDSLSLTLDGGVKLLIILDTLLFEVVKITSCYFLRLNRDGVTDELIEVNNDE